MEKIKKIKKIEEININILDIIKNSINLLTNEIRQNNIIYYGNNIIKQDKDRLDIWIVINDDSIIENSSYYNSLSSSSTSSLEIIKNDDNNYTLLNKLGNNINEALLNENVISLNYDELINYLTIFSKKYDISIITMKFSNHSYNNIILYDIFNASLSKNFNDIKPNINKKYFKYKKKYINTLSKGTLYNINNINNTTFDNNNNTY
jgi:hypothetical protein